MAGSDTSHADVHLVSWCVVLLYRSFFKKHSIVYRKKCVFFKKYIIFSANSRNQFILLELRVYFCSQALNTHFYKNLVYKNHTEAQISEILIVF